VTGHLAGLVAVYGSFFVGGVLALESIGIPVPGETVLLTAAAYAGATHHLDIWSVFLAGVLGAVCGNFAAFWIGRKFGPGFLRRYGRYLHLTRSRLKIGQYLFLRHGGKFVVLARLVPLFRSFAGLLAGANKMPGIRFSIANLLGAVLWVGLDCTAAYFLGKALTGFTIWIRIAGACLLLFIVVASGIVIARYEQRLKSYAQEALPDDAINAA